MFPFKPETNLKHMILLTKYLTNKIATMINHSQTNRRVADRRVALVNGILDVIETAHNSIS